MHVSKGAWSRIEGSIGNPQPSLQGQAGPQVRIGFPSLLTGTGSGKHKKPSPSVARPAPRAVAARRTGEQASKHSVRARSRASRCRQAACPGRGRRNFAGARLLPRSGRARLLPGQPSDEKRILSQASEPHRAAEEPRGRSGAAAEGQAQCRAAGGLGAGPRAASAPGPGSGAGPRAGPAERTGPGQFRDEGPKGTAGRDSSGLEFWRGSRKLGFFVRQRRTPRLFFRNLKTGQRTLSESSETPASPQASWSSS